MDDEDDDDQFSSGVTVRVNRIELLPARRVARNWREKPDGTFLWRKRVDVQWMIEKKNAPEPKRKPLISLQGFPFRPHQHSVTLDDFVFLIDKIVYVHLPTNYHFNARHINTHIFGDRATWPLRLLSDEGRTRPTTFIRKFNRVAQSGELDNVMSLISNMGALDAVA